ncbi:hypothetical protein [Azotobacter chroococcum]|nr:hypothetical protein [Azotobacter chroococcum]
MEFKIPSCIKCLFNTSTTGQRLACGKFRSRQFLNRPSAAGHCRNNTFSPGFRSPFGANGMPEYSETALAGLNLD